MAVENDKIVYGGDMMLFLGDEPLAFSTSAELSMNMDTREISSKDSGNYKNYKAGRYGWEASTDGLAAFELTGNSNGLDDVFASYTGGTAVDFAFASKTGTSPAHTVDASKTNFTGSVLITSMTISASDGDNATYSVSLIGLGELALVAGV